MVFNLSGLSAATFKRRITVKHKNDINVLGHTGGDAEITTLPSGMRVANFSVATSDQWTDKDSGEKRSRTQWHRIVVFNQNLVDLCEKAVKKGDLVDVEGTMEYREFEDREGTRRTASEIVIRPFKGDIILLSFKDAAEGRGGDRGQGANQDLPFDARRGQQQSRPSQNRQQPAPRR